MCDATADVYCQHMCEVGTTFKAWQEKQRTAGQHYVEMQLRDNYYVRSLGGASAWHAPEGALGREHLLAAAQTLAMFDVVMTVDTLQRDAPVQMGKVGLPGFSWGRTSDRSRADNLQRAQEQASMRTAGVASCQVPPTDVQVERLVEACAWDAVLYEFARMVAARRTQAANSP